LLFVYKSSFARIDAADTDLPNRLGGYGRCCAADLQQLARSESAQAGQRHPVQTAARRQFTGVEIGVRVEPKYAQRLALVAAVASDCRNGTNAQAVIAP
jgi:hypothetical protein